MTTTLLRKALLAYLDNTTVTEEDCNAINAAIVELDEIEQRTGANDAWKHECYILHAESVCDLMNMATYDEYGKMYVEQHGKVNYADYERMVLNYMTTMTTAAIELGYDIVRDLYDENEQQDAHNTDGTFKHN